VEQRINPYAAPQTSSDPAGEPEQDCIDPRLVTTGKGLKLIYYSIVGMLLFWILSLPAAFFLGGATLLVMGVAGLAILSTMGGLVVGTLMCLTVPEGVALRPFIAGTVICEALIVLISLVGMLGLEMVSTMLLGLFWLLAFSFFLLFLYRLADFIRRPDLVRRAGRIGIFGASLLAGFFAIAIFGVQRPEWAGLFFLGFLLLFFISYANLIGAMAKAIRSPPPNFS